METIVKSCEDILNFVETCSDPDINDVLISAVLDILESLEALNKAIQTMEVGEWN